MPVGYSKALWIPSLHYTLSRPSWVAKGGVMWIICHGTASGISYPAQATANDFATTNPYSTHYVVGYDGTVVQSVSETDTAWGNGLIEGPSGASVKGGGSGTRQHDAWWDTIAKGDPNSCTISIEHAKTTDNLSALSDKEKAASFALIKDILTRWGRYIPAQYGAANGGITGHYSMQPISRSFCPGPYPWDELISYLNGGAIVVGSPPGNTPVGLTSSTPTTIQTYNPLLGQVHSTLVNNAGFLGLALAVDEAEQFPGWIDLTSTDTVTIPVLGQFSFGDPVGLIRSTGATLVDNFVPFLIRSGLVTLGFTLLVLLLYKAVMDSGLLEATE